MAASAAAVPGLSGLGRSRRRPAPGPAPGAPAAPPTPGGEGAGRRSWAPPPKGRRSEARQAPEVPLRGAPTRRASCQRRVRATVPPSHRSDWAGSGVCGKGGARAGRLQRWYLPTAEPCTLLPPNPRFKFLRPEDAAWANPRTTRGFKMQVGLGGGGTGGKGRAGLPLKATRENARPLSGLRP